MPEPDPDAPKNAAEPYRPLAMRAVPRPPGRMEPTFRGRLERIPEFRSQFLSAPRDVLVYLPPGYDESPAKRYPIVYLQDGQNLFDPRTAFIPGNDWRLGETAERLVAQRAIEPTILVGVSNTGLSRVDEYTPVRDEKRGGGGHAALYGRLLVEELKPFLDRAFRTRRGPESTALGGSSLGGLVSVFVGLSHPEVFGRIAALSPSVWWGGDAILEAVCALPRKTRQRIWLDIGTKEGSEAVRGARSLRDALVGRGWRTGFDLQYVEAVGAGHNEPAWARRAGPMLRFLFGAPWTASRRRR